MKQSGRKHKKGGAGIIETIVYVMIFAVISVFVVNSVLSVSTALAKIRLERKIVRNADSVMQRLLREIRLAKNINASSTLAVNPGALSLRTFRSATNTNEVDADFYLSGGRLLLKKATTTIVTLTEPDITVTNLVFRQITSSSTSKSIKIELGLQAENRNSTIARNFYSAAILRGTY